LFRSGLSKPGLLGNKKPVRNNQTGLQKDIIYISCQPRLRTMMTMMMKIQIIDNHFIEYYGSKVMRFKYQPNLLTILFHFAQ